MVRKMRVGAIMVRAGGCMVKNGSKSSIFGSILEFSVKIGKIYLTQTTADLRGCVTVQKWCWRNSSWFLVRSS